MDSQLQEILTLFHEHKITYWLDSGTLLGLMRDERLLENDMDLDIGIWSDEEEKLKDLLPLIKEEGYTIYSASYRGQVFKYNFIPHHHQYQRKVDINLFREAGRNAWCPMYYFIFTSNHEKSESRGRKASGTLRSVFRYCWVWLNKNISVRVAISSFPWRPFLNIGTWWIPAKFFKKVVYHGGLKAYIPLNWESYLEFRYGTWRNKTDNWVFYRDDGGIVDMEPSALIDQQEEF